MSVGPPLLPLAILLRPIETKRKRHRNQTKSFWKISKSNWMAKMSSKVMTEEAMMAAALRAELQIAPKADLYLLAGQLSLTIVEVQSKSFEGALLRSSRTFAGRILVRKGVRELGRR